jgi:predicted bacteriocin transport accessory protein
MDLLIKDKIVIPYSFEKVENEKDKYYLYFGRNDCPYCQDFLPELYNLADRSEVKLYYVDTNIKNEQLDELLEKFNVEYVPTLIKIDKGKSIIFDFTEDELGVFID